jgi:hypothetical protein
MILISSIYFQENEKNAALIATILFPIVTVSKDSGKAITFAAGECNGRAIDSAAGADELIRVLLAN